MDSALVVRTFFGNQEKWINIVQLAQEPQTEFGFKANLSFVDNPENAGRTVNELRPFLPDLENQYFIFIVDHVSFEHAEFPILCIDLESSENESFRVIPSQLWSVENNLSLANMDFDEFANAVDEDNIFRGFPE